jgi:hypothetical protein
MIDTHGTSLDSMHFVSVRERSNFIEKDNKQRLPLVEGN